MLVLTRERNESVVINDVIEITIVGVTSTGKVTLGITAPKNVPVHRKEIQLAIERERKESKHGAKSNMPRKAH